MIIHPFVANPVVVGASMSASRAGTNAGSVKQSLELAKRAVEAAMVAIPGPLTFETRSARLAFLREHFGELFDPERSGYLTFDRFAAYDWASAMIRVPSLKGGMNFNQYLLYSFGSQENIDRQENRVPGFRKGVYSYFHAMTGGSDYFSRAAFAHHFS